MRASEIAIIVFMLTIPSVGYAQQNGPDGGAVGGKVGSDLSTPPTQSAPATQGPFGRPAPVGRPAGYTGPVTPGQVAPENVQVTPRPGGMGSAYVNGRLVLVDPSNRVLRVIH
jgi:hypothetical protein